MIWNLNLAYKQQQLVGCILIGKVKVLPFVSMIYDSLESTCNPYLRTYKDFSLHSILLLTNELFFFLQARPYATVGKACSGRG
jgi:hypothetical protein